MSTARDLRPQPDGTKMPRGTSLYRIVEDGEGRLVLRGRRVGLWLLALILLGPGLLMLYLVAFEVSRRELFVLIAGGALGLFFTVCGLGALRWALTYRAGVEVDREAGRVRFVSSHSALPTEVPFAAIAAVEVAAEARAGPRGRRLPEFRVVLRRSDGDELLVDRSADRGAMEDLARRIRGLWQEGLPQASGREGAAVEAGAGDLSGLPAGIAFEREGAAAVYRWATLPRSLFWAFFWGSLTLFLAAAAGFALFGAVSELGRQPAGEALLVLALAALTLLWMYRLSRAGSRRGPAWLASGVAAVALANFLLGISAFLLLGVIAVVFGYVASLCAFVVFGRCRLRIGPEGLESEERVFGLPLVWRRRSLPAEEIARFRIQDPSRGGGAIQVISAHGRPFTLMIPQGKGAFSRRDLERLRSRWLADLAGSRSQADGAAGG